MLRIFIRALVLTGLLLLVPLVAMQFSEEVDWTLFDFVAMGGLLFVTNVLLGFISDTVPRRRPRIVLSVIVFVVFLLVWAQLSVGLFR